MMPEPGNSKGWTFDSFETWIRSTSEERARAIDAALEAANEKARTHNDVLGAMKDAQSTFVTKDQAAVQFKGLAIALGSIVGLVALIVALSGVMH